jgi:monoamine oxidase
VTLPCENPTQAYWQEPPADISDVRSTQSLPERVDVIVVGSGITGAAVAWHLLQNVSQSMVMLEARQACSGATGRNGTIPHRVSHISCRAFLLGSVSCHRLTEP